MPLCPVYVGKVWKKRANNSYSYCSCGYIFWFLLRQVKVKRRSFGGSICLYECWPNERMSERMDSMLWSAWSSMNIVITVVFSTCPKYVHIYYVNTYLSIHVMCDPNVYSDEYTVLHVARCLLFYKSYRALTCISVKVEGSWHGSRAKRRVQL